MYGIQIKNEDGQYRWITSWSEHDGARSRPMNFPTQAEAEIQAQQLELKNYKITPTTPAMGD